MLRFLNFFVAELLSIPIRIFEHKNMQRYFTGMFLPIHSFAFVEWCMYTISNQIVLVSWFTIAVSYKYFFYLDSFFNSLLNQNLVVSVTFLDNNVLNARPFGPQHYLHFRQQQHQTTTSPIHRYTRIFRPQKTGGLQDFSQGCQGGGELVYYNFFT